MGTRLRRPSMVRARRGAPCGGILVCRRLGRRARSCRFALQALFVLRHNDIMQLDGDPAGGWGSMSLRFRGRWGSQVPPPVEYRVSRLLCRKTGTRAQEAKYEDCGPELPDDHRVHLTSKDQKNSRLSVVIIVWSPAGIEYETEDLSVSKHPFCRV
jgi:hypothetical protein